MKSAAFAILLSFALGSEAFAILRPRYPAKPTPPFRGHVIIIEDHSIQSASRNTSDTLQK
jgi:hypothetical protein